MKKWLLPALLLLICSGAAWAGAADPTIASSAVSGKTDLSIAYLSSVFGTVSGVLNGTSGQMLGKLLYQFNQGLLVVAGGWLGFTILTMVFKSAISGSFMQQDNKVPLVLLRVAFGFGLLIPNPSTGYTLLQGIVMQVVVQGVKLADQVWEYGLDYMNSGGSLWFTPAQNKALTYDIDPTTGQISNVGSGSKGLVSKTDSEQILGKAMPAKTPAFADFRDMALVQQIMAMEACMVQSSIDWEKEQGSESNDFNSTGPQFSVNENFGELRYEFPNGYADGNQPNINCGAVYWKSIASKPNGLACQATTDGNPNDDNTQCGYVRLSLREMIYTLLPAVKKYVCLNPDKGTNLSTSVCSGIESTGDTTYMTDAMMGALLNYVNLMSPLARQDIGGDDAKKALSFIPQAKKDGWMTAGRYYWDLLRVEGAYNKSRTISYSNYLPNVFEDPSVAEKGSPAKMADTLMQATVGANGFISQVNGNVDASSTASQAGATGPAVNPGKNSLSWLFSILLPAVGEIFSLIGAFSVKTGGLGLSLGPEPILWMHNIGMTCISIGGNLWLGTAFALFLIYLPANACQAANPLGASLKGTLDWLQPILLIVAGAFFSLGMFLGYYLPLYPYMLFTFGVIGWIIIVIEAMVAAPLVAMGITHPESHDFLGRSQQAVMLLLGVFLRPALMVIGLFAAMILCQVSLSILLYTFAGFANDIFYVSGPITGAPGGDILLAGVGRAMGNVMAGGKGSFITAILMALIVFPMFLAIFVMLVYTTTTNCFALIHQLPDYIMTWIGGPQSHSMNAKEMTEQVKSGIASGSDKVVSAQNARNKLKDRKEVMAKVKGEADEVGL